MKKYLIVTLVLVLALSVSGLALAENEAYVNQEGNRNAALLEQDIGDNAAFIEQLGAENNANVRQGGADTDDGVVSTWASVYQSGYKNAADVDQVGARYGDNVHQAFVAQSGDHNYASLEQSTNFHGALASIAQEGVRNIAEIDQLGNQFPNTGSEGYAVIDQDGVANYAKQWQRSYVKAGFMAALIDQNGTENYATQKQDHRYVHTSAPDGYVLYVAQNGYKNVSIQHQGQEFGTRHGIVEQSGDRNYASQTQERGIHYASIVQNGADNWAVVNQQNIPSPPAQ